MYHGTPREHLMTYRRSPEKIAKDREDLDTRLRAGLDSIVNACSLLVAQRTEAQGLSTADADALRERISARMRANS